MREKRAHTSECIRVKDNDDGDDEEKSAGKVAFVC